MNRAATLCRTFNNVRLRTESRLTETSASSTSTSATSVGN